MKESDLYIPVRDWLRARGYTVHIEIFDADVLGINADGHIVVVELKLGLRDNLYAQLSDRARWADEVWAAVPPISTKPKSGFAYYGYGLLIISGDKLKVQRKARPQPWHWHHSRKYRCDVLARRRPAMDSHVAGLPSCAQARLQRDESRVVALSA